MEAIKTHTEIVNYVTGWGGGAKFVDSKLIDVFWSARPGTDGLNLSSANIRELPRLMRFLRAVERAQLEIEYHAHILASNSGHGETQIWFQKPEGENLEEVVGIGAHIYEDRFGMEPNVLILNDKDDADVRFWKGKIDRKHWLLPTHFRLTYRAQDDQKNE